MRAIFAIGEGGAVGRGKLGSLVGLGQGEVRTLIRRMKEQELIVIEPEGCKLSRKGVREFQKLREKIPWSSTVNAKALGIGAMCSAVLVRAAAEKVRKGIEQRDASIRVGANGAFTAIFTSGHFALPGEGTDSEKHGPPELWASVRAAGPEEGDVVIIVVADSQSVAEFGALSAALTVF